MANEIVTKEALAGMEHRLAKKISDAKHEILLALHRGEPPLESPELARVLQLMERNERAGRKS